jgi:hypothetical protein
MANANPKKYAKDLNEIFCPLGRNQSLQFCAANFINKSLPTMAGRHLAITGIPLFKNGEIPTKSEFLELLWQEMESVVSDLHEYVDVSILDKLEKFDISAKTEINPRKKLF